MVAAGGPRKGRCSSWGMVTWTNWSPRRSEEPVPVPTPCVSGSGTLNGVEPKCHSGTAPLIIGIDERTIASCEAVGSMSVKITNEHLAGFAAPLHSQAPPHIDIDAGPFECWQHVVPAAVRSHKHGSRKETLEDPETCWPTRSDEDPALNRGNDHVSKRTCTLSHIQAVRLCSGPSVKEWTPKW